MTKRTTEEAAAARVAAEQQFYTLGGPDGRTPLPTDLMTWARDFETRERRVALTPLPHIFETAVRIGPKHFIEVMDRYSTWAEAEDGHAQIVAAAVSANDVGELREAAAPTNTVQGGQA